MIKAIFMDYMGTLISDSSKYAGQVIKYCCEHSRMESFEETYAVWFQCHDRLLERYNGRDFKKEYDIAIETFGILKREIGFSGDSEQMVGLLEKHWMYSPVFEDVEEFFAKCRLPIYIVTNNDTKYIEKGLAALKLHPAGIISSEMSGYYKPRKEIFQKALEVSGCLPQEAIHVGDSMRSDIQGAQNAGITPILLNREKKQVSGNVKVIHSLRELYAHVS